MRSGTSHDVPMADGPSAAPKLKGAWTTVGPCCRTVGCPPWWIQEDMISPTGSPDADSSAAQRSDVTVLA